jgi:hypothetical protein
MGASHAVLTRGAVVLTLTTVLATTPAAGAGAAPTQSLVCAGIWEISLTPGIGTAVSTAGFAVVGGPATLQCAGPPGAAVIAGPVTYLETGTATGSCASGTGTGEFVATVPTNSGPKAVRGPFTFGWAGATGWLHGSQWSGTFSFAPTSGDCFTRPAERAAIVFDGVLTPSAISRAQAPTRFRPAP